MAGYKPSEKRNRKGQWTVGGAVKAIPGHLRERMTGSPDKRPIHEVIHGAIMRNKWDREEQGYNVKYDAKKNSAFLKALEREQNASLKEKAYNVNHPVKGAVKKAVSAFGRFLVRGKSHRTHGG